MNVPCDWDFFKNGIYCNFHNQQFMVGHQLCAVDPNKGWRLNCGYEGPSQYKTWGYHVENSEDFHFYLAKGCTRPVIARTRGG